MTDMVKIKIFLGYYMNIDYDDSVHVLSQGLTDWEEVTEQDYEFLKSNLWRISNGEDLIIIRQDKLKPIERIASIREAIRKMKEKEEADKITKLKRKEEAAAKREAKKVEKERRALEAILEQNPDYIKELIERTK